MENTDNFELKAGLTREIWIMDNEGSDMKQSRTSKHTVAPVVSDPIIINGKYIAYAHGFFAYSAFFAALIVGCWLHYYKIVKNSSFGYPQEWFPSVSATIGDRYPERSVFQILIALTAGPRFLLLFCNYLLNRKAWVAIAGIIRTFTCGGWVYITSTDDHDWHDIFMISYIVLTLPWTIGISYYSPKNSLVRKGRSLTAFTFFATLIPLIYWFIQHKVHVRPGAYSVYAYFEWSLIILDIGFDTWSIADFQFINFSISNNSIDFNIDSSNSSSDKSNNSSYPPGKTDIKSDKISQKASNNTFDNTFDDFWPFLVNCINSFYLFSISTAIFVCVWHFPLWDLGLTGYEACIVVFFISPLLLLSRHLSQFLSQYPFITRTLSILLGVGAFKCETPKDKLLTVSGGVLCVILSFVNEASSVYNHPKKLYTYSVSLMVGLLASTVIKFLHYSNNPVWPIMKDENGGQNEIGVIVGIVSSLFTPVTTLTASNLDYKRGSGSLLLASLGFGAFFFSLMSYLTDSSTLVLWSWTGYPIKGPTPITGALVHISAIAIGIVVSIKVSPQWLSSLMYNTVIGGGSCAVLYFTQDWSGFIGGCVYSSYLASIAPIILQSVAGHNPALLFSLGFVFMIIFSLGSIWIVAYAFVPLGWVLRERTDIILFSSYFLILLGVLNYRFKSRGSSSVVFNGQKLLLQIIKVLVVLLAVSGLGLYQRYPDPESIKPYNESLKSFTAGIWCVHFGLDNNMWSSHDRMRDLIKDAQVDIIGLLETDTQRLIGGNRDFTQKIAEDLRMYADYGPGPNKHTWGAALLSKFPIVKSKHHLLPSPEGELAPAIEATLDIYGELVDIVVFHSGQFEDKEDRRLQSLAVEEIMAESSNPLVLLSYLVTRPLKGNYLTYASENSRMHDIDNTDLDRWCEYIMFRDLKKIAYARISRSTITDTELQIAKFRPLSETDKQLQQENDDFLYGNNYIHEKEVPHELRMPNLFKGKGVRGHKYHVFKKPRYFALE